MTQNEFKTIVITAEEGKYLTQKSDVDINSRVVATTIALGKNDSVDNYKEITKEEADLIKEQKAELHK